MPSIQQIKASDGSSNASVATVQSDRSPLATTLIVDTVAGYNVTGFAGTMGTPHTFTDPITSETITVISDATAVDFTGHVDGSNLEIDDIAPGYTDGGSEVGDIIIIRPTTQYADNVADVLEVAHDDNGTLKDGSVDATGVLANNIVTPSKLGTGAAAAYVATSETTTSTSYANLTTTTDTVTVTIGANGLALVSIGGLLSNDTSNVISNMGFAISGATTQAAADSFSVSWRHATANFAIYVGRTFLVTGLASGSTTFKAKYKAQSNTSSFTDRRISVVPL